MQDTKRPTTEGNTLSPRAYAYVTSLIQRLTDLEQTNRRDAAQHQNLVNRCFALACGLESELFGGPDNEAKGNN